MKTLTINEQDIGYVKIFKDEIKNFEEYKNLPNAIVEGEGTDDECVVFRTFNFPKSIGTFNGISVNSKDLLTETKDLLLKGNADWTPTDIDGLIFKKETLTSFFEDDYFDEEDKPSSNCFKEISAIVDKMENTNSVVMYLR